MKQVLIIKTFISMLLSIVQTLHGVNKDSLGKDTGTTVGLGCSPDLGYDVHLNFIINQENQKCPHAHYCPPSPPSGIQPIMHAI